MRGSSTALFLLASAVTVAALPPAGQELKTGVRLEAVAGLKATSRVREQLTGSDVPNDIGPAARLDGTQDRAATSRAAVQELAHAIQTELQGALKAGGPVNAITVCSEKAPAVTAAFSKKTGLKIRRTSLKPRNPDNAPDAWEERVLRDFETRKARGEDPAGLEYSEELTDGGKTEVRYMKAIVIADGMPCLACHGSTLTPEVAARLKTSYPRDQATGYKTGDIRGAFSVRQMK